MKIVVALDATELGKIRSFAEAPENLYRFPGGPAPGDREGYVTEVDVSVLNPRVGHLAQRLRVVYTLTQMEDGQRYRHASLSLVFGATSGIEGEAPGLRLQSEGLPSPSATEAVGLALGFRGRLETWITGVHAHDYAGRRVIVIAQRLEDA